MNSTKLFASVLIFGAAAWAASVPREVTFHRDVEKIVQDHCQECHRAGEIAPFALMSYKDARPWAKAMKEDILTKKMPPWFADPQYGHFADDRSLSKQEIETLVAWVDGGAKEGDPKDAPAPRTFTEGWNIPTPDLVLDMNTFHIPAKGDIQYQYVVLPPSLTMTSGFKRPKRGPATAPWSITWSFSSA